MADDLPAGGLRLDEIDIAYEMLSDSRGLVPPDAPECGELIRRVASTEPSFRMPPGDGLSDLELCALVNWARAGAAR